MSWVAWLTSALALVQVGISYYWMWRAVGAEESALFWYRAAGKKRRR